MKHIGLTGNIGSGKTTVCRVFGLLGIPVFYADIQARMILERPDMANRVAGIFGRDVLDSRQGIDRSRLAAVVFSDKEALQRLNALIHPAVREEYERWAGKQTAPYAIMEAAILFETGYAARFDKTILVAADLETRISRVCKRDGVRREDVIMRMNNQRPQEELTALADYVIYNDDNVLVLPQILTLDIELGRL